MEKLLWIRYDNEGGRKFLLFLPIGTINNLTAGLATANLAYNDIMTIRQNINELVKLSPEERVQAIKKLCPEMMKSYRTLKTAGITILKEYPLSRLGAQI